MTDPLARKARTWRLLIVVATWLSYAGYYFCRKNFAIVKGALLDGLDVTKSDLAHIFTAFLAAYMVGQLLTSYAARTVATRKLLLCGMALTLACNAAIGYCTALGPAGYWPIFALMIVNGLAQSTGWPGNIGVLSNWLRREERGRVMAVWATSYQLGSILAKAFAALMLGVAGVAWSFWGAALVMLVVWIFFFACQRDNPEDVGLPPLVDEPRPADDGGHERGGGWSRQVLATILWMGCSYFVFKFLRYALDSWAPLAISELFGVGDEQAGYISTLFDWVGFLGVLAAGWLSDKTFGGRRHQTILLMSCGMLAAFVFLAFVGVRSVWLFGAGLALCGFMLMGPDSLLSGVGAVDVGGRDGAAAAAGLINGVGSIGPIFQEELIGVLLDRYGYRASFYLLIGVALLGIVGTAYLSHRARRGRSSL